MKTIPSAQISYGCKNFFFFDKIAFGWRCFIGKDRSSLNDPISSGISEILKKKWQNMLSKSLTFLTLSFLFLILFL